MTTVYNVPTGHDSTLPLQFLCYCDREGWPYQLLSLARGYSGCWKKYEMYITSPICQFWIGWHCSLRPDPVRLQLPPEPDQCIAWCLAAEMWTVNSSIQWLKANIPLILYWALYNGRWPPFLNVDEVNGAASSIAFVVDGSVLHRIHSTPLPE
jgi:hypothetical protein